MGIKTKPLLKKDTGQELKPNYPVEQEIDSTCIPETKNNHIFLKLFFEHPLSVGILLQLLEILLLQSLEPSYWVFLPNARKNKISNEYYKYHIIIADFRHLLT
jgi:hypothetical protein